jgi:hypothetical protein
MWKKEYDIPNISRNSSAQRMPKNQCEMQNGRLWPGFSSREIKISLA